MCFSRGQKPDVEASQRWQVCAHKKPACCHSPRGLATIVIGKREASTQARKIEPSPGRHGRRSDGRKRRGKGCHGVWRVILGLGLKMRVGWGRRGFRQKCMGVLPVSDKDLYPRRWALKGQFLHRNTGGASDEYLHRPFGQRIMVTHAGTRARCGRRLGRHKWITTLMGWFMADVSAPPPRLFRLPWAPFLLSRPIAGEARLSQRGCRSSGPGRSFL